MKIEQRLSLITLGVSDVARSKRFYEDLGWNPSPTSENAVVFFQLGGIALALFSRASLAEDAKLNDSSKNGFSGITLAYNVREKAHISDILNTAAKAGAKLLKPAEDTFWGGHSGYFADPDGHIWEVAWNPFWTINEDGSINLGK